MQVKGIRAHKDRGEREYIQACIAEIKNEIQSGYADVKTMALRKLIYVLSPAPLSAYLCRAHR